MNNINLTIGSDPEFVIMCGGSVENALEIFQKVGDMECEYERSGTDKVDIEHIYNTDRFAYLDYAMSNMDFEYLKDMYDKILKNHPVANIAQASSVIMDYYTRKNCPVWNELPIQVQFMIKSLIEEEYMETMAMRNESYFCTTEIGCDGQSALGELRPKYGNNPIEHFNEILKLIKEMNDLLEPEIVCYDEELQIKAGAYQGDREFETFQLGGHIHLGFDKTILLSSIGEYLSFFCGIPLTLITDTEGKFYECKSERDMRHWIGQYGQYGSYREKDYGIEFRMPSSWLVSPQITIGALSLAYVTGYEFLSKRPNEQHIWNEMFEEECGIHPNKYIEWYNHQNWVLLQGEFEPIKLEIQQMELYPKYKEYIDYILDMIDNNETWDSERDIMPLWAELW